MVCHENADGRYMDISSPTPNHQATTMNEPAKSSRLLEKGRLIQLVGFSIWIASFFFALNVKTHTWCVIALLACCAVLVGISASYFVARSVPASWRTPAAQAYFTPYIVGATIWLSL